MNGIYRLIAFVLTVAVGSIGAAPRALAAASHRNGLALSGVSHVDGVSLATLSAINGVDVGGGAPPSYTLIHDGVSFGHSGSHGGWTFGDIAAQYYGGLGNWSHGSSVAIGKVEVPLTKMAGDISGKTYRVRIWTVSGNNLDTEVATSDAVTGSNAWDGTAPVTFTFSTPYSYTTGNNIHFTVDAGGVDGSNYAGADNQFDILTGNLGWWNVGKTATTYLTGFDFVINIYSTP